MNKLEGPSSTPVELPEWVVECLNRLFSSISDPTRIRIVHALTEADRLNVTEIAEYTGLSISAISHQLRLLRDRAMLQAPREGRSVYYSLADATVSATESSPRHRLRARSRTRRSDPKRDPRE